MKGAIAAGHSKTAAAGLAMLEAGGNAFDAAVAAVFAACVAEPALTSVTGGGFFLAHTPQRSVLFDFFTQTPRHRRSLEEVDFYPVDVNFGSTIQEFHIGLGSVATPGNLKGLLQVHQHLGQLPLAAVLEPAIADARFGVEVSPFQAYSFQILSPILLTQPEGRSIYAPQGDLLKAGELLRMPDFADTLEQIAKEGAALLYTGELARRIVDACEKDGGYLTAEDLEGYAVVERSPLQAHYRGRTLLTNPPPSSGGTLIAFALKMLESLDLTEYSHGSLAHVEAIAQIMRLTNVARKQGYDEQIHDPQAAERFLSPDSLAAYQDALRQVPLLTSDANKWGSTTHISVVDEAGNAASVTTSNGEGSGYLIPGTGIMMNNMLGEEDLHPTGFNQWQPNVRISSMMAPTMILDQGNPAIVLGSGGSNRIRTAILQVVSNLLDFGQPVETAVDTPRVHWENGHFNVEPGLEAGTAPPLDQFPFHQQYTLWENQNMFFGGVHAVVRNPDGTLSGAGDRRRGGVCLCLTT